MPSVSTNTNALTVDVAPITYSLLPCLNALLSLLRSNVLTITSTHLKPRGWVVQPHTTPLTLGPLLPTTISTTLHHCYDYLCYVRRHAVGNLTVKVIPNTFLNKFKKPPTNQTHKTSLDKFHEPFSFLQTKLHKPTLPSARHFNSSAASVKRV
jgi:hypothetical protein